MLRRSCRTRKRTRRFFRPIGCFGIAGFGFRGRSGIRIDLRQPGYDNQKGQ